jgi:hypothetical protein
MEKKPSNQVIKKGKDWCLCIHYFKKIIFMEKHLQHTIKRFEYYKTLGDNTLAQLEEQDFFILPIKRAIALQ